MGSSVLAEAYVLFHFQSILESAEVELIDARLRIAADFVHGREGLEELCGEDRGERADEIAEWRSVAKEEVTCRVEEISHEGSDVDISKAGIAWLAEHLAKLEEQDQAGESEAKSCDASVLKLWIYQETRRLRRLEKTALLASRRAFKRAAGSITGTGPDAKRGCIEHVSQTDAQLVAVVNASACHGSGCGKAEQDGPHRIGVQEIGEDETTVVAVACRVYERFHGLVLGMATVDQVSCSSAGILGWWAARHEVTGTMDCNDLEAHCASACHPSIHDGLGLSSSMSDVTESHEAQSIETSASACAAREQFHGLPEARATREDQVSTSVGDPGCDATRDIGSVELAVDGPCQQSLPSQVLCPACRSHVPSCPGRRCSGRHQ